MNRLTLDAAAAFALDATEQNLVCGGIRRARVVYSKPASPLVVYRTLLKPAPVATAPDRRQNAIIGVDDQN
ncbi:MAG TPA: hypothetical protein PLL64_02525 [Rhodothermales bacterium]|nr:hypothetical protein [Rhodothermales bacterium]HRR07834.1 hypothetical protein [Rhodothermales bacterium]